jgi:two-component system CheB/CheR fusion protein
MQMQLVDDLLDVSRIVAGKLNVKLRPVDLGAVVRAAVEVVSGAVQRKSIRLDVDVDAGVGSVAGDSARLQQVVSNLLTNAIKFTPEHGKVAITVAAADGHAVLKVSDTGTGIEAAFLPRVFNRFSQEDTSNTRLHGGLGLGLAIVRHLVEQHGGTVEVESPGPGKGSTFSVTLPLMKFYPLPAVDGPAFLPRSSEPAKGAPDYHQLKGLRVLVVDDDLETRETVAQMLKEIGAQVRVAESAAEARLAVEEFKPRVLLCDIAMPGEDGYTFIRKLRAQGLRGGGATPALALTALVAEEDHHRSLAAGFQMHLTKPVDIDRLTAAVVALADRQSVS